MTGNKGAQPLRDGPDFTGKHCSGVISVDPLEAT